MKGKVKILILGLITLTPTLLTLRSANAASFMEVTHQETTQDNYTPAPPPTNQTSPMPATNFNSNPSTFNNTYSAQYISPINTTQLNTNYQPAMNLPSSVNTDALNPSTWNSTYAVGNYGITNDLNPPEFASSSPDDFAQVDTINNKVEIPAIEKIQIDKPSDINNR